MALFLMTRSRAKRARDAADDNFQTLGFSASPAKSPAPSPSNNRRGESNRRQRTKLKFTKGSSFSESIGSVGSASSFTMDTSSNGGDSCFDTGSSANLTGSASVMDWNAPSTHVISHLKPVPVRLLSVFDPSTKFDGDYCKPNGLSFQENGDIIISDAANNAVKSFNLKGDLKVECTITGNYCQLVAPSDVCVIPKSGEIVVCDEGGGDVKVFTPIGRLLTCFQHHLHMPISVDVNSKSQLLVVDEKQRKILVYSNLTEKGIPFIKDTNICLYPSDICVTKNDDVVVLDRSQRRVMTFTSRGNLATPRNQASNDMQQDESCDRDTSTLLDPVSICNDVTNPGKNILIADKAKNRIVRYSLKDGQVISIVLDDSAGLSLPQRIATDETGVLAVIEEGSNRVKLFRYAEKI